MSKEIGDCSKGDATLKQKGLTFNLMVDFLLKIVEEGAISFKDYGVV